MNYRNGPQSSRIKGMNERHLKLTDPQAEITQMSHKENYNQMQTLGDALSKKGDDFNDPDFDEIVPNLRKPIEDGRQAYKDRNNYELEAIQEMSPGRGDELFADQDFSLKNTDR